MPRKQKFFPGDVTTLTFHPFCFPHQVQTPKQHNKCSASGKQIQYLPSIGETLPILTHHRQGSRQTIRTTTPRNSHRYKRSRYATDKAMQARSPTLLSYFNSKFKQKNSWEEFHFPPRLISLVMSSLRGTQLTLEWWRRLPGLVKNTGDTGVVTQPPSKSTLYSKKPILSSEMSSLQHSLLGSGQGTTAGAVKSLFKESLTPLRPLARPSNWLDSKVPYTGTSINTTSKSNDVSKV